MINEKLVDFNYYYNKLPLYLRNSETFPEHLRIWVEFIQGMNNYADDMLGLINVFNPNYIQQYGDICDDFLDKIGALYGVRKKFSVTYLDDNSQEVTKELILNRTEFYILIKAQIIKNFFDGTNEQLNDFYLQARIPMIYVTATSGQCDILLLVDKLKEINENSENIIEMFKSGLLSVESLGIHYNRVRKDSSASLEWGNDSDLSVGTLWDNGEWVI